MVCDAFPIYSLPETDRSSRTPPIGGAAGDRGPVVITVSAAKRSSEDAASLIRYLIDVVGFTKRNWPSTRERSSWNAKW